MYIPQSFQLDDQVEKISFIKRYPFATIVTATTGIPVATHLPFVVEDMEASVVLSSHFAVANNQSLHIEGNTALVIFSEPHAYISPRHYDKRESVPTWDYIAVHAYGICRTVENVDMKLALLEKMIKVYEPDYLQQWASLSSNFKMRMLKGIVAFSLEVTELQGQQKLSQNKTETERMRIVKQLETSPVSTENDLVAYFKKTVKKNNPNQR